ncbi:MAG: 2-succinyl-5-enolpyruvyl-6-hydroxy-3-cyclohexene-1-carboxylic-acid synthase, partial [Actinobacteria bacterium]|nr:2-succinyl-5-enolpyruvyl-6-hydroxy-3-cyclohexene-1-carboxylic-acid synthase [Actinomycetota bacterium]
APLSFALARAADAGRLRLHVHIDERSAGFLALGLAKATGTAAMVVCTSGTAVANLLPAVVEASYAQVPMIAVTADRPAAALERGASQTIAQADIFGDFVRAGHAADETAESGAVAQALCSLWHVAHAEHGGPVHVNIAFEEPLVPAEDDGHPVWPSAAPVLCTHHSMPSVDHATQVIDTSRRGVVVLGDLPVSCSSLRVQAEQFARAAGWPLVCEPTAGPRADGISVRHHQLVTDAFLDDVECVVSVGRFGLGRHLGRLVRAAQSHIVVQPTARPVNPFGTATEIFPAIPEAHGACEPAWLRRWQHADEQVSQLLADHMTKWRGRPTGAHIAAAVLNAAGREQARVFVAASRSVRDVDLVATWSGAEVFANLGANGIDGIVSTARGLAADQPVYALLGDLAFLHDHNGLLGLAHDAPDLTLVVADDNGGAIFSDLEQAQPHLRPWFEAVFGTPHNLQLIEMVKALGISAVAVDSADELAGVLTRPTGVRVVVVSAASRDESRDFRAALRAAAAALPQV